MGQGTSILAICLFIFIFLWTISSLNLYDTSGLILENYNSFISTSILSFFILLLIILKIDPELKLFQTISYLHVAGIVLALYILFSITIHAPNALFTTLVLLFVYKMVTLYYKDFISALLWLKHELLNRYLTTRYVDIAIIISTILLCLGYFFGRNGLNYIILPHYKTLINKPIYLNNLQTYNIPIKNHYNYSISTWIYINPQPLNTNIHYNKYTPLINYQKRPEVLYKGKGNSLLINMLNGKTKQVTTFNTNKLKLQAWNHLVINYHNSVADVFLNNELVGSKDNIVPYINHSDEITTGIEKGIHGGIKHLQLFRKRLTRMQIQYLYNYQK
tara:strand:- start:4928 stop:5923 length:996 start_codon:yes stop_codon:yes gene_type:complete